MAEQIVIDCETGETSVYPLTAEEEAALIARDIEAAAATAKRNIERTNREAIEAAAVTALEANKTFLAIGAPTNTQVLTQVRALTRQMNGLARIVLQRLDATD